MLLVLTLLASIVATPARQPVPSVKDVMKKVGAYVDSYGERASIVVGSEQYTQTTAGNTDRSHASRVIAADVAIVRVESISGWVGFRDVIEVDGIKQTDREDRLLKLLTRPGGDYGEARRLSDEGARFNIGLIQRNFNVPTSALFFFSPANLDRFKFSGKDVGRDGTWHIAFREVDRPTLIRTPEGESVPSEGDLWVNPDDGTVLRTVLKTETHPPGTRTQRGLGRVEVSYRFVESIGMWLPAAMDEQFETTGPKNAWDRLDGHATYSNYRQFTTSGRIK
jgi:hypothetical protein